MYRYRKTKNEFYINVGLDSFAMIGLFTFASFMPTVMTDISSSLSLIGISQILMMIVGLSAGYIINRKVIRIGVPDDDMVYKSFISILVSFILMKFVSMLVPILTGSVISANDNVVLMAAVAEEAFFGLLFTTLFFRVFMYLTDNYSIATGISLALVGVLFAIMHIGVYGLNMSVLIILFISRIILSFVLLYSRNFSVPILVHFLYNFTSVI